MPETKPAPPPFDTANRWMVCAVGRDLAILRPPRAAQRLKLDDVISLAAWLVVMAEASGMAVERDFDAELARAVKAIRST